MISKLDKYKYANYPLAKINSEFIDACEKGNLELVKYLLLDPNIINAEIDYNNYAGIKRACCKQENKVVMFLLTGKELKKTVSPNIGKGDLLRIAVSTFNKDLIDYFVKDKKLDLNENNDLILKSLVGSKEKTEIAEYLIIEHNLKKTQCIIDYLNEKNWNLQEKKDIAKLFEQRESVELMKYVFADDDKLSIVKKQTKVKKI